jgi:hypothetical protein
MTSVPFWLNVIYVNAIRERLSNPLIHSNKFYFHLLFGHIFLWISSLAYPNQEISHSSWPVVDRLSKNAHLCSLQHPFTPSTVAQMFMDNIFKLHGMLDSIVSNRDPTFTNNFWQELFRLQGTQLHLSTTYHPQTDGQT